MLREAIAKLSKHSLIYATADQLARIVSLLLLPLMTGYLGTSDFGTRDQVATTLALLSQLAGINIVAAMSRFYFEKPDDAHKRRVISTTVLSVLVAALVFACVLGLAARPLGELLVPDAPGGARLVLIALGIFVFMMLRETESKVLQTQERSVLFGTLSIAKTAADISLQIYVLVVLHAGLAGLLWAMLISECSFACLLALILLPRIGLAFSGSILAALYGYALPLIPNGVLQFALHSGDRYILQALGGREPLGIYAFAYKLGQIPNYVLGPFLLIWYPYMFSVADEPKQRQLCGRLAPYVMLLMTSVAFVIALFAREIVHATARGPDGPDFYGAWIALPLVALGYWFWGLFQLVQTGFYVVKKTRMLPLLTLSAVLVNFYLNFLLIPVCGFEGAAIATVVTFAVLAFVTERRVQQVFAVAFPWRRIFTPALAAAGLTVALLFLPAALETWTLALKFGACLAWITWAWFGGFFDRDERHAIVSAVSNFAHRKP